uniref:N-acetyltransferase domain-containing protein n=1 Tax=Pseudo-nitzschia australis TaxID=44445 RepID=A0A7S4AJP4_9STRA
MTSSSIGKTCFDAIRAKQSAVAAGYDPIGVGRHEQEVYEELLSRAVDSSSSSIPIEDGGRWKAKARRQTPLVNAGYASRVLSISYAIRSYVSYHKFISAYQHHREGEEQNKTRAKKQRIRIVFLGCGVDVIGLWTRCLLPTDDNSNNVSVTIVEVDTPEVCSIKRKMIADQGMVKNIVEHFRGDDGDSDSNAGSSPYHTGTIVLPQFSSNDRADDKPSSSSLEDGDCDGEAPFDYVLIPGDLNDTSTLETILASNNNNNNYKDNPEEDLIPTLVVSELVLSYVSPSGTDRLLRWCSDRLCRTPDSALVLLEALGSPIVAATNGVENGYNGPAYLVSVEEGYRRDYCQKFNDKMERGRSTSSSSSDGFFHPIGSSGDEITRRLVEAGFARTSSTTGLGVVSSFAAAFAANSTTTTTTTTHNNNNNDDGDDDDVASSKTLECPEVFDEHAALILHLRSYAMACAWIDPSQQHTRQRKHRTDVAFFRRMMCPWKRRQKRRQPGAGLGRCDLAFVQSGLPIIDSRKGIVYTEIEICDEESVQNLFRNTYGKEYTDKYPAIRKMVKGVLNKDLRKTETITTSMTTTTTTTTTTRNQLGHHNTSSNTNTSDSNIGNSREAIFDGSSNIADCYRSAGGIFLVAIRYTRILVEDGKPDDDDDQSKFRQVVGCVGIRSSDGNADGTLEIFRLAVDIHHRGQGIASNLLRVAEEYARQRQRGRAGNLRFVANTLTILEAATGLYESHGYRAEKETPLGSKLVLRTYAKN